MNIEIKAAIPIEWGKEYYLIGSTEKNVYAPCVACDNTGKVTIKGKEYPCPRCHGNWREKEVVSKTKVYHVDKYRLSKITVEPCDIRLYFTQTNPKTARANHIYICQSSFHTMRTSCYNEKTLTDDHAAVMAEVKRLNAEARTQ